MRMMRLKQTETGALMKWARDKGLRTDDIRYVAHIMLWDILGENRPGVFSVEEKRGDLAILGYIPDAHEQLLSEVAVPEGFVLESKPMPAFKKGRKLRFRASVVPEIAQPAPGGKRGIRRDAFLVRAAQHPEKILDRGSVYADWMGTRLGDAVRLKSCEMRSFQISSFRRGTHGATGEVKTKVIRMPDACMSGVVEVVDPVRFEALLLGGVGRHKAYGAGMLLLNS